MNLIPIPRFTGLFIPAEILAMEELTPTDQMLLAWIDALQSQEHGGCFASNEYFAQKLRLKINTVKILIAKLVDLGLIERISFNGRMRILRVCRTYTKKYTTSTENNDANNQQLSKSESTAEVDYNQPQTLNKINRRGSLQSTSSYIYSKEERKDNNTPLNPLKGRAANAACGFDNTSYVKFFGSFVRLKDGEFEALNEKYGKKLVDEVIEEMNDWCAASHPKGYKDYAAAIRQWIRRRKQAPSGNYRGPQVDRRTKNIDGTPVDSPYDGMF